MSVLKWEPWVTFFQPEEILPIEEPPCKHCALWLPRRIYNKLGFYGVQCCLAQEQHHDFSCYKEKPDDR